MTEADCRSALVVVAAEAEPVVDDRRLVQGLHEGLGQRQPIRYRADEVVLLGAEPDGAWARREALPLDGA